MTGAVGTGSLVNADSGMCLDVNGHTYAVDQWTCDGGNNQLWRFVSHPGGGTALQAVDPRGAGGSYLAVTVDPENVVDGTTLELVDALDSDRTEWNAVALP